MSAPGRRSEGRARPGEPHFVGPEDASVTVEGRMAAGREMRILLAGWSAQDVLYRKAGELSRGGLVCLVRALREELGALAGIKRGARKPAAEVRSTEQWTSIVLARFLELFVVSRSLAPHIYSPSRMALSRPDLEWGDHPHDRTGAKTLERACGYCTP